MLKTEREQSPGQGPGDCPPHLLCWYLTFGVQYGTREEHPTFPAAHADGVVLVQAHDQAQARNYVMNRIGPAWSDLIPRADWLEGALWQLFPRGVIEVWDASNYPEEVPGDPSVQP